MFLDEPKCTQNLSSLFQQIFDFFCLATIHMPVFGHNINTNFWVPQENLNLRLATLDQQVSCFNENTDLLRHLLKQKFQFSRVGQSPKLFITEKFPCDTIVLGLGAMSWIEAWITYIYLVLIKFTEIFRLVACSLTG